MNERTTTVGLGKGKAAAASAGPVPGVAAAARPIAADKADGGAATGAARSAGRMIREARRAQGLHIEALAAAIKVSQHKLELLEADRVDELPDATFARALAQTVCRFLKIDPQPVLAQLPQLGGYRLDHLSEGINTPFRDRPGHREPGDWSVLASPAVWAPAVLVLAALLLYLAPAGWLGGWPELASRWAGRATAPDAAAPGAVLPVALPSAGGASAASGAASDSTAIVQTVHSAPPPSELAQAAANAPARGASAAAEAAGPTLQLRASEQSWVEVVDARAQVLLSRMLQPGETVSLEGSMPLKLKVGNAAGTEAVFRGQVIDLAGTTRDNVARLELK